MTPLLSELREGSVVANMEELTRSASEAAADIHKLQNEVCDQCSGVRGLW